MNNPIFEHIDRSNECVDCLYPDECKSIDAGDCALKNLVLKDISKCIPLGTPSDIPLWYTATHKASGRHRSEKLCWHSIYNLISGFIPSPRVPSTAIIAFLPLK